MQKIILQWFCFLDQDNIMCALFWMNTYLDFCTCIDFYVNNFFNIPEQTWKMANVISPMRRSHILPKNIIFLPTHCLAMSWLLLLMNASMNWLLRVPEGSRNQAYLQCFKFRFSAHFWEVPFWKQKFNFKMIHYIFEVENWKLKLLFWRLRCTYRKVASRSKSWL